MGCVVYCIDAKSVCTLRFVVRSMRLHVGVLRLFDFYFSGPSFFGDDLLMCVLLVDQDFHGLPSHAYILRFCLFVLLGDLSFLTGSLVGLDLDVCGFCVCLDLFD